MLMTFDHKSKVISTEPDGAIPALFTSTFILPYCLFILSIAPL